MKKMMILALMLCVSVTYAQENRTLKFNNDTNLIEATYFHDNGVVSQTGTYTKDGKLEGVWLTFDQNGKKTVQATYENGKKTGKWLFWNKGSLKEVDYSENTVASVNTWELRNSVAIRD